MDDITNLSHLHRQRNVGIVIRDVPSNEIRVAKEKETAGGKGKGKEKVTSMGKGKENAIQLGVAYKVISKASLAQRARRERERTNERMQSRQSANPISVSPIRMGRLEDAMETTEVYEKSAWLAN